jgi:hypothetical protein
VVVVLVVQVLEMVCKALHLFLVLLAQRVVVLDVEIMAQEVMVVLAAVPQMALLEARQHLGRVMLAALAQVQAAV